MSTIAQAPSAPASFQTRIVRASIRDHQDGFAVQKRFTFGR